MTRWFRNIAIVIGALILCGFVYESIGNWQDSRQFPEIGRPVRVGRTTFNLNCSGTGSPTIILESGLGLPSLGWVRVQPEVAKFARVCSYDRAGYGWSDQAQGRRASLQLAKELKSLLAAAEEKGPFVLVGPSFGGYIIRVYTGLYPSDVAGLVLVDASHEDQQRRIDELVPAAKESRIQTEENQRRRESEALLLLRITGPIGIERLRHAIHTQTSEGTFGFTAKMIQEFNYLNGQQKAREAVLAEFDDFSESGLMAKGAGPLGDRPLIVLTAGRMEFTPEPAYTREIQQKLRDLWINVLQVEEVRLSTRGRQVVLNDSGHAIQFERPDAVISAIRDVWNDARAAGH